MNSSTIVAWAKLWVINIVIRDNENFFLIVKFFIMSLIVTKEFFVLFLIKFLHNISHRITVQTAVFSL
jgi:hypothetical protein